MEIGLLQAEAFVSFSCQLSTAAIFLFREEAKVGDDEESLVLDYMKLCNDRKTAFPPLSWTR